MKHVALTLLAAACGALSASAIDATNARIWLDPNIKPEFTSHGGGINVDKLKDSPTYSRTWQYVSIPVHVEGAVKGDNAPHYIPELKVRISLVVTPSDAKGKDAETPELLTREITYVDIPLAKGKKTNTAEGIVNVGVFVSPSGAFTLAERDGNLAKKLLAVAVEGEFMGSPCNRVQEKPSDAVTTAVVLDRVAGKNIPENWWKKKSGNMVRLYSIAETPFAASYANFGFPATSPLYGGTGAAPAPAAAPAAVSSSPASGPVGGPTVDSSTGTGAGAVYDPHADSASSATTTSSDDAPTSGKKKSKKSRR